MMNVCTCVCVLLFQEYLSLLRWNDGNYWALKDAIKRNHTAIAKLVKKFKVHSMNAGVLNQYPMYVHMYVQYVCTYVCMYRIPLIISFPLPAHSSCLLFSSFPPFSLSPLLSSFLPLLTCPFLPFPGCSIPACSPSVGHWQHCLWQQSPFTEGQVAG